MSRQRQGRVAAGLTLIVTGLVLFLLLRQNLLDIEVLLLVLGAVFLALYFMGRRRGFLIPGALLLGLGAGLVWKDTLLRFADAVELGLGLGFVGIYLISLLHERRGQVWALIPGAFFVLLGLPWTEDWVAYLFENWPLILVLVGIVILLGGLRASRGGLSSD